MQENYPYESRKTISEDIKISLNKIRIYKQQVEKWIDLSVQNAFDNAKENGYDFITLGSSTKEIAIDMKEKDWNLENDMLEDIEAAIDRYKARIIKGNK